MNKFYLSISIILFAIVIIFASLNVMGLIKGTNKEVKIGETAILDGYSLTIREASWDDENYVILMGEENLRDKTLRCAPPMVEWKLIDKNGIAYQPLYDLENSPINSLTIKSRELGVNQSNIGYVYFQFPKNIVPSHLLIHPCQLDISSEEGMKIYLEY